LLVSDGAGAEASVQRGTEAVNVDLLAAKFLASGKLKCVRAIPVEQRLELSAESTQLTPGNPARNSCERLAVDADVLARGVVAVKRERGSYWPARRVRNYYGHYDRAELHQLD